MPQIKTVLCTYTIKIKYEGFEATVLLTTKKPTEVNPDKSAIEYSVLVKDIAGKPLSDFYVTVMLNKTTIDERYTNVNGTCTFELAPDFYDVYILGTTQEYNKEIFKEALKATAIHRGSLEKIADALDIPVLELFNT